MSDDNDPRENEQTDQENLAEVIRLQAEALARISSRMTGHRPAGAPSGGSGRPPARRGESEAPLALPPGGPSALPVLSDDPALSAESLPVLTAFRQFLDAERRRARNRMIQGAVAFTLVLIAVGVTGVLLGRAYVLRMRAEIRTAREAAEKTRVETASELQRVSTLTTNLYVAKSATESELRKVAAATTGLQLELTNQLQNAQTGLTTQVDAHRRELEHLSDMISSLQIENATLINTMRLMADRESAPPPEAAPEPAASSDTNVPAIAGPLAAEASPKPEAAPANPVLLIRSPNLSHSVQMRLPPPP